MKQNLANAKKIKNDEFYTTYETIESEMSYYWDNFKGKTILCNCDDPELFKDFFGSKTWKKMLDEAVLKNDSKLLSTANQYFKNKNPNDFEQKSSQFWLYFHKMFSSLGLKELIATHYNNENKVTYGMRYKGGNDLDIYDFEPIWFKTSNGDFRSEECIKLLKESDIVITNPPFSLFREFVSQIIENKKKFLIIGNMNAISYKEIFKLIKNNELWLGVTQPKKHKVPFDTLFDDKKMIRTANGDILQKFGNHNWFTNLDFKKRYEKYPLNYLYENESEIYRKYCNYDAINVDKIKQIPVDYFEPMGVPISFLLKWNPDQFDIIGLGRNPWISTTPNELGKQEDVWYEDENGKKVFPYMRMIIKRRK
ncbi:adenine-specific methyltransferase EcoRI family protein [Spiroplasma monobiae]|uniref:Adenine-specific methyltransferase n=1 Tax=Spiroplasma monobiae MQ-1 TaxID=1336748 RepID=A0A2K9LUL0_SPISQ|nr:adenine-specific methyltransferase EcoRI family protein [Spiroplasma monobiae]AUM62743.1 hypothetical protein SMONO_v1c04940 [Spiroplasma monobiae MQ-1]